MTEIIGESAYQHLLTGIIMAVSLWGLFLTPKMIPVFTRSLTRHPRNILVVKGVPKQRSS
ncbi:hypothetical protein [uncultured Nitrospira sp.]|uniref:hypothetical protein n=1 Tax=uncultured Nitrospira sp. TaxID=157176 RepID=UPI0031402AE6